MTNLSERIYLFIKKQKACIYSDIAREFAISKHTVKDLINELTTEGKVVVVDKGIAKLVMVKYGK